MTTFTLQDLSNGLPTTPEEDEAFKQMENIGLKEMFAGMGQDLTAQHAPVPQPTPIGTDVPNIGGIIDSICTQLHLLGTVISQSKAQPEEAQESLQETIALVLQQADWFKDMVKDEVESRVESEVESYFERRFDPTDHFDFGDAVSNEVDDRLDDVVRDRLDEAVEEQLGEVVAEKLKSIRVVFD
jgi:hypothetical protein